MGNYAANFFHFWGFEVDEADKVDSIWGYLLYYTQAGKECKHTWDSVNPHTPLEKQRNVRYTEPG